MAALKNILRLLGRRLGTAEQRHLKHSQHIHVANPWHAVGIVSTRPGCPVCGPYKGVRFLAREAPALPLKGCPDPRACQCVYRHYEDRRAGPRRAAERRAFQPMTPTVVTKSVADNRRRSEGRRGNDGH